MIEMSGPALPTVTDRESWLAEVEKLRVREKAHTREGDAIAAARRRLPMVEIDPSTPLLAAQGTVPLIEAFERRTQLFASFHMWHTGKSAADQCEGCTFFTGHVQELSYLHARDVTYAVFCQGPYEESSRYRDFMDWRMPWYSVPAESLDRLVAGRHFGMKVVYLRDGDKVYECYWTTGRGTEAMANSYAMLDMTPYGRQEDWEESPAGWPKRFGVEGSQFRSNGRPSAQWSRVAAGRDDDLGVSDPSSGSRRCCG